MNSKRLWIAASLWGLISSLGCTAVQVTQQVQAGRIALKSGRPSDAAVSLKQAAEVNPDYRTSYRLPQSVLAYLGRAYYETERDEEALRVLEKAASKDHQDHLAHLYFGLTRLRNGDRERGRQNVTGALKGIYENLEYIAADNVNGIYWDPARMLRAHIEKTLAGGSDVPVLIASAEQIGRDFDDELDSARRDEGRARTSGGGGGGD